MAVWDRLRTLLFGGAIGAAASDAVRPVLEPVRQKAWKNNQARVLAPGEAARMVAHGVIDRTDAVEEASRSGVESSRVDALIANEQAYPGSGELDHLSNRGLITPAMVRTALERHGIPEQWHGPILDSFQDILTPGELAAAIHRGLVPDPGLLRGEQPQPPFNVEAYPVYDIPVLQEAQGSGYDRDRLGVLVGLQGLPMGTHEAAQAYFRGIITHGDYIRAFNESNSRNEWAQAVLDYTRQIPTARDFFENALRGYHDLPWALEQAKRHGMSDADALVIYQNQGRPMNIRQITQALARGAKFNPEPDEIKDPYLASVVEGPIKPGYYELALALKYTPPTAFVIRQLAQSGVWDEAKTAERLKWLGWIPEDADDAAAAWTGQGGGAAEDQRVKLARTQAVAALKRQFVAEQKDDQGVLTGLSEIEIAPAVAQQLLTLWTWERLWTEKTLTPTQIKKAYSDGLLTIDEAVERLVQQHYGVEDARLYLQS